MKKIGMSILTATALASTVAMAGGDIAPVKAEVEVKKGEVVKRKLKGNMIVEYLALPGSTDSIMGMFQEGMFYGRLRSNSFYWDWDEETSKNQDNKAMGMGGSLIFKSAAYNGFSFTAGYYGSMNPEFMREDWEDAVFVKAGKDTFSGYDVSQREGYGNGMHVLGEAYLKYKNGGFDVIAGRQLFESVFTASNDTKMIPNTFDGVSLSANLFDKTKGRVGYFTAQKLRDHTSAHDVVTYAKYTGNDDAAAHKGLTEANFIAAGKDPNHELIVADVTTGIIPNLKATLSLLSVPGVIKDIVAEAQYMIPLSNGWSLAPAMRYFYQMDDGAGVIGGANLAANITGYTNPDSMDGSLFAAKLELNMPNEKGLVGLGYSKVADDADILAPWRGFPTGGYTRAMGQYNWNANTKSYMAFAKYKFTSQFDASVNYAIQDFDDTKDGVQADSNVLHIDTTYKFTPNLYMKTRVAFVDADVKAGIDYSYNEYRLEFNYLF